MIRKNTRNGSATRRTRLRLERLEDRALLAFIPELVQDFVLDDFGGSFPEAFTSFEDKVLFTALTVDEGRELWVTDGTEFGTKLVKDISPGRSGSGAAQFVRASDGVYFSAETEDFGREIWFSNGTSDGTRLVKDVLPGPPSTNPSLLTVINDSLFFEIARGGTAWELWRTDGRDTGTHLVAGSSTDVQRPYFLNSPRSTLYFLRDNDLWVTDGTTEGTRLAVSLANVGAARNGEWSYFAGAFYFSVLEWVDAGPRYSLWKTDGTPSNTEAVKFLNSRHPARNLREANGTLFFSTAGPESPDDLELWRSDGTPTGTFRVADVRPGSESSYPSPIVAAQSGIYFVAEDATNGVELWYSDGTVQGTLRLSDTVSMEREQNYLTTVGDRALFTARASWQNGYELWQSGGTPESTRPMAFPPGVVRPINPRNISAAGGKFYFSAQHQVDGLSKGYELWVSDGTAVGTHLVKDIAQNNSGSGIGQLTNVDGTLMFSTPHDNWTVWKSDGTSQGTVPVADQLGGLEIGARDPREFVSIGNVLMFTAFFGDDAFRTLWRSDGTPTGTYPITIDGPVPSRLPARDLINANGILYFVGSPQYGAQELWKSDGTSSGTKRVHRILHPAGGPYFANADGRLYFESNDAGPYQLWTSDGTHAGTIPLVSIYSSSVRPATAGEKLFFVGVQSSNRVLWVSDGTTQGTRQLIDFGVGRSAGIQYLRKVGEFVYAIVATLDGWEVWRTDGTEAGSQRVSQVPVPANEIAVTQHRTVPIGRNGDLYFLLPHKIHGWQLWRTDDASGEAILVRNLNSDAAGEPPAAFVTVGDFLCFAVADIENGWTLWQSDGTSHRTRPVTLLVPGGDNLAYARNPSSIAVVNGILYFTADDGYHGLELWKLTHVARGPGDLNDDGNVDRADIAIVVQSFGTTSHAAADQGDLDINGRIGIQDLIRVRNLLSVQPASANAVHSRAEPAMARTVSTLPLRTTRRQRSLAAGRPIGDVTSQIRATVAIVDEIFAARNRRSSQVRSVAAIDHTIASQ
jgi:ELWxxDGT repeat protein